MALLLGEPLSLCNTTTTVELASTTKMEVIAHLVNSPVTWVLVTASTAYIFYRYVTSSFSYFSDQGIPGPKPLPIVGNMWGIWKANLPKHDQNIVNKFGRIFGYFDGSLPNLWITDADMIKSVFVKDFDHFVNRRNFTLRSKVVRKFLTLMRDQDWKDVRSSITPAFTTGKIKRMSVLIKECADRLIVKFDEIAKSEGKIDAKDQFSVFTMDVIARCVFGMKIENLGSKDDVFMRNARVVFNPPVNKTPLFLILFIFPNLLRIVGERMFIMDEFKYFFYLLEDLIKERNLTNQKYNDFVEAATETISGYTKQVNGKTMPMWDKEEVDETVIAQSVLFLLAGFDTTASTLTNSIFQLARNPHVQEKLYDEINSRIEEFGQVSHEMILNFPYIDQVINEVMRFYPALPRIERECNKDITINGINIKKGVVVTVPTYALHYDPEYYPDPFKFDPDRWSPENKANLNSYAYMPFGMGPRNCVGMRFAMEEIKIVLCTILRQYRFFPVAETPEEMQFEDGMLTVVQPVFATVGIEIRN
uniref:Uncharacterized protein n=1 Tax=Daphnia galeata TaxID=27404 RepID=A0A8J2RQK0_9CRUS|nr:unnamed protein product [Daphnia galeata]